MIDNHNNFYLVELKNEALSSIFSKDHNLKFFLVASKEFNSDIETINNADTVISNIVSSLGSGIILKERFSSEFFPSLDESMLMEKTEEIESISSQNIAKSSTISLFDKQIVQMKAISIINPVSKVLQ